MGAVVHRHTRIESAHFMNPNPKGCGARREETLKHLVQLRQFSLACLLLQMHILYTDLQDIPHLDDVFKL